MHSITQCSTSTTEKKKHGWSGIHKNAMAPIVLTRFLAKVRLGYTVWQVGLDCIQAPGRDVILGRADGRCFQYVGGGQRKKEPKTGASNVQFNLTVRSGNGDTSDRHR